MALLRRVLYRERTGKEGTGMSEKDLHCFNTASAVTRRVCWGMDGSDGGA